MIVFHAKQRYDGAWVPDHAELKGKVEHWPIDPRTPYEAIRTALFEGLPEEFIGQYTLEYPLEEARQMKAREIDTQTRLELEQGFEYQGARYGSTASHQGYYNTLRLQQIDTAVTGMTPLQYPVVFASIEGAAQFSAADSAALGAFLNAAAARVREIRDFDVSLKQQIQNATTSQAVLAIVDPRAPIPPQPSAPPPPEPSQPPPPPEPSQEPPVEPPPTTPTPSQPPPDASVPPPPASNPPPAPTAPTPSVPPPAEPPPAEPPPAEPPTGDPNSNP